jgi:hypothetical protein
VRLNISMPLSTVMSSWIERIGYTDTNDPDYPGMAWMTTHENPDLAYGYQGIDHIAWMSSGSMGGYWWDNIQGTLSPAMQVPTKDLPLAKGGLGSTPAESREFKIKGRTPSGGVEPGLIAPGTTRAPFGIEPPKPLQSVGGFNPTSSTSTDTYTGPSVFTSGYVTDPGITGSKKTGPGQKRKPGKSKTRKPIVPYNLNSAQNLSFRKFNALRKNSGLATVGTVKYQRWRKHKFTHNSLAVGSVMSFDIDLHYAGGVVERVCPKEWKKIENHEGTLWLYEDQGHGGVRMEVGTYKYENGKATFNIPDDDLILANVPAGSNIAARMNAGLFPEMSTEYYCGTERHNGIDYQVDFHDALGRPRFDGIVIVNYGNCGAEECRIEIMSGTARLT